MLAHYVREVQELTGDLTRRLDEIDAAAERWVQHDADVDRQLCTPMSSADLGNFNQSLRRIDASQVAFFDALEGFLAAWARLSLLFFPGRGDSKTEVFRKDRASTLRSQLGITDSSPLADRDLRNSWMHFDERMDYMLANGHKFDRQRFVRSWQAKDFIGMVPRLMIIDTRTVYFLTQAGQTKSVELSELRKVVDGLGERVERWWETDPSVESV